MSTLGYSIILIILYLAGLAYVSWAQKSDNDNYIIGDRALGFWQIYGSVISYMRAGSNLIFWFAFVALMGFGSIWILISFYTAFIIMTFLGEKARRMSIDGDYITFTDLIQNQQGPIMAWWINIFSFYVIMILTVSQLFVAGNILGGLLNVSEITATLLCAAIVGSYVVLGGFINVVRTDFYQAVCIIVIALLAIFFVDWPSATIVQKEIIMPNWQMVIGFGIIGFAVPASTDMWQRFFAVKEEKTIVPATMLALVTDILIVMGLILFIRFAMGNVPMDEENFFLSLFQKPNDFPLMTALFGVFILSAILSTMDNQVFNLASITAKNIFKLDGISNKAKFVWVLRLSSIAALLIFSLMALTIVDLMKWIINTYAFVGVITPFIFYAVLRQANSDKFLALSVLVSAGVYWYIYALGLYSNLSWYGVSYLVSVAFVLADYSMGMLPKHKQS